MKYGAASMLALLPLLAHAAEPLRMADNAATPPRFYSLNAVRNGQQPGVGIKQAAAASPSAKALRSDATAMNNGFFRLDRNAPALRAAQAPLIIKPAGNDAQDSTPRIILGATQPTAPTPASAPGTMTAAESANPVLALFNSATAGAGLPSFRDALNGGSAPALPSIHHWPLPPTAVQKVSSGYGLRAHPLDHSMKFHGGIDIAAANGTPVLASADGQVSNVTRDALYGQSISILHADGSESLYGHLSSQSVAVGQRVTTGQVIGAVGATGRVTGPHLDYRVTQDGITLDPLKMLPRPANVAVAAPLPLTPAGISQEPQSYAHPSSPRVTRPKFASRSERLIVVR